MVALSPLQLAATSTRNNQASATTTTMGSMARVCFAVDVDGLQSGEFVFVSGSCEELGHWDPQLALKLNPENGKPSRWRGELITSDTTVQFRYFIGFYLSSEQGDRLIIARWESFRIARSILVSVEQRNGVCREAHVDLFGYYAGRRVVSEGWLQHTEENQILLRVHGNSLKFYKTGKERKDCRIKIIPLDVRNRQATASISQLCSNELCVEEEEDDEDIASTNYPSHSSVQVAVLSNSNPRFFQQSATGTIFNNNKDYLVFKTHSVAVEFLAFFVEIFSDEGKRIGTCYALPSSLQNSFGSTKLPFINSTGRPMGQISLEYLFIQNLRRKTPFQSMETSFSRHWKKRNTLEVGHRGAGNSYTKFAAARENTIHSLNTAAKNGADYVEFDVQLTKDKIAVIYHDFHVLVSVAKRGGGSYGQSGEESTDFHEIAVKDLRLNQVKLLMLEHVSQKQSGPTRPVPIEEEDLKPFPTLVEVLSKVDPDCGFNIEVKYPMMQTNGEHECENYFERNEFLDVILSDIMNHAGDRRILFSSFDPDICQMLSMKQNRYPVLFLCIGESVRYTPFTDQRTSTSLTAVNFAASADILGVNFNSEDLLKDPYPVQRATEFGLVTFVWGDDLDRRDTIHYFKKTLGVDGLIYDRIGEDEGRRNVFLVEREQKRALFLASSGTSTPRAPSPADSNPPITPISNVPPLIEDNEELEPIDMNSLHISPRVQLKQS